MKAFTFLGLGELHESTYTYQGQCCETRFFAEALVSFFGPDTLVVVTTDKASQAPVSKTDKTERLTAIQNLLDSKTEVIPVTIPEGENENQLWEIFNTVVSKIEDGDRVLFDITHGFRSLPFLTFLALAYVRNVKREVKIERVVYGAYEAVERDNPYKPVFDLTPFIGLLDWMGAVAVFQQTGNAQPIAKLVEDAQNRPYKLRSSSDLPLSGNLPTQLKSMGSGLENLSAALLTNRSLETQTTAANLVTQLDEAKQEVDEWAQPFGVLFNQIQNTYQPLALQEPKDPMKRRESLIGQHQQIKWYIQNQQYLQAITLAREWLISYNCYKLNKDWIKDREEVEEMMGEWGQAKQEGRDLPDVPISGVKYGQESMQLFNDLHDLRNDLAHCGMRPDPRRARRAVTQVENIVKRLNNFIQKIQLI